MDGRRPILDRNGRDALIFVSMENWDDIWRRNQFVCAELTRRRPGLHILFVGLPIDVSNSLRRGRVKEIFRASTYPAPGVERITVTHPPKLLPDSLAAGRVVNEAMFRRHVRTAAARLGLRNPVLWLNPHYAVHAAGRMGESAVIYDITDDWTTLTQAPRLVRRIREQDAELCRRADATIVCSERLRDMKRDLARHLHLIPNGVDARHYARVLDGGATLPDETRNWPRPVLGYTGTLHPDRVDVGLIESLAEAHNGSVALVGPNFLSAADNQRLLAAGNVFITGPVPYARIPDYMAAFDVCITPHRMTPFTESLNPIKLWEYLAGGLPIVSTDVAGFRDYPEFVHLARTSEQFIAACGRALAEGPARSARRREEAARHSWSSRVDQVEAVIATALERRSGKTCAAPRPSGGETEVARVA
jgi:glycosyltransferase involved in cell wall biosynthesis